MEYKVIFSDPRLKTWKTSFASYPRAASEFGSKLIQSVRNLATFPRLGRVVPEKNDENIREIVFKSYRIFYRVKDEAHAVEIVRFWHAARGEPQL